MHAHNVKLRGNNVALRNSKVKIKKTFHFSLFTFNSERQLGFTLVELLVSISIILIVASLSFASYSEVDRRQKLISAGQTMKNIIRDAQSRSYNGEIDCNRCNCSPAYSSQLSGWYIDFSAKKIYGECQGIIFSEIDFNLSNEIIITPHLTPPVKLLFKSNPPAPSQKATVCLSSSNLTDRYYPIYVNSYGDVSDENSLTDSCAPK